MDPLREPNNPASAPSQSSQSQSISSSNTLTGLFSLTVVVQSSFFEMSSLFGILTDARILLNGLLMSVYFVGIHGSRIDYTCIHCFVWFVFFVTKPNLEIID